jgi:hypothetical protein
MEDIFDVEANAAKTFGDRPVRISWRRQDDLAERVAAETGWTAHRGHRRRHVGGKHSRID